MLLPSQPAELPGLWRPGMRQLLTTREAALALGVEVWTIYQLASRGYLRPDGTRGYLKPSRRRGPRWPLSQLREIAEARRRDADHTTLQSCKPYDLIASGHPAC